MLTRIISQGRKDGNPQVTVELNTEDDQFRDVPEIAGMLEIRRTLSGTILATVTILEYVPPKAKPATA